jgi:hypothetical protein
MDKTRSSKWKVYSLLATLLVALGCHLANLELKVQDASISPNGSNAVPALIPIPH